MAEEISLYEKRSIDDLQTRIIEIRQQNSPNLMEKLLRQQKTFTPGQLIYLKKLMKENIFYAQEITTIEFTNLPYECEFLFRILKKEAITILNTEEKKKNIRNIWNKLNKLLEDQAKLLDILSESIQLTIDEHKQLKKIVKQEKVHINYIRKELNRIDKLLDNQASWFNLQTEWLDQHARHWNDVN